MPTPIKILFIAAEAEPIIKIGGLADVAGTLPLVLRKLTQETAQDRKLDVRLALPFHRSSRADPTIMLPTTEVMVYRQGGNLKAKVFEFSLQGMPVYFIDGEPIHTAESVYSTDPALDREKYTFFSLAVLEMLRHIDWQPDILHANDWHTALALFALHSRRADPLLAGIRSLITLHNLPYMGGDGTDVLPAYGLLPPMDESLPPWARTQPLPLGLWAADAIIPVSPTYAREILTPEFGCGLDHYLSTRSAQITGILNGLDLISFDPETDQALAANFDRDTLSRRGENKRVLQEKTNLPIDPRVPIMGMVGRINQQKGVDIAIEALPLLADLPWQFVILGSGDPSLETAMYQLERQYPDRVRAVFRYDETLGRMIYGGADIFLMPSRYEPCGLAQMIAMRYGCVPVVRATGGLKDTVQEGKTGFLFQEPSAGAMAEVIRLALRVFNNQERWLHYQASGMGQDHSWTRSARHYALIYRSLLSRG